MKLQILFGTSANFDPRDITTEVYIGCAFVLFLVLVLFVDIYAEERKWRFYAKKLEEELKMDAELPPIITTRSTTVTEDKLKFDILVFGQSANGRTASRVEDLK